MTKFTDELEKFRQLNYELIDLERQINEQGFLADRGQLDRRKNLYKQISESVSKMPTPGEAK